MPRTIKIFAVLLLATLSTTARAQSAGGYAQSFKAYRDSVMAGYRDFRDGILSDYASFLDSAWSAYEAFSGVPVPTRPKPPAPPEAPPQYTPPAEPTPVVVPAPKPQPVPPAPSPKPPSPPAPPPSSDGVAVHLYGLTVMLPPLNTNPATLNGTLAEQFAALAESGVEQAAEAIGRQARLYSLGDWGAYMLARRYSETVAPGNDNISAMLQTQLMMLLGYKVTLARAENNLVVLLCFEQDVYSQSFVKIDGQKFYIYPKSAKGRVSVPSKANLQGRPINLVMTSGVRLPMDAKPFSLKYGNIAIGGNVNRNVIRMIDDYPHMDISGHAATVFDAGLRESVMGQIARQIDVGQPLKAANDMLHFTQLAFPYKTDNEQFGHEKYFFFEELLYYPYSDCEDRSVFFANLVRHLLGYDVVLLGLPNHEATAVATPFDPPKRNYVLNIGNSRFFVCDPTYMHADVGMMHQDYFNAKLEVHEW